MWRKLLHEERGYSLVTVALLFSFVVAPLLVLVVDIGHAHVQQQRMQTAADAGALAGTQALHLEGPARATVVAADYARRNGAKNVTVTVNPGAKTVRVLAKTDFPTFVAGILGYDTLAADNPAKAIHGAVTRMADGGVYPITVYTQTFEYYPRVYDFYVGVQPGNFGWLSWDGTMSEGYLANCLADPRMSAGYINPVTGQRDGLEIGKWVWGRPGIANSSSVRNALNHLRDRRDPQGNPIPITIVVWDQTRSSGSDAQYRIAGFAQFTLTDYRLPGQNRISGYFQRWVILNDANVQINPNGVSFGLHGVKLTE